MPQHTRKLKPEDEPVIVARYLAGETTYQIAEDYPVTFGGITDVLKRNGINRCHWHRRRRSLNESAFDVWTPDAAYWAGFLFADGCVTMNNGCPAIIVRLASRDCDHVKRFRDFLGSTHAITSASSIAGYKPGAVANGLMVPSKVIAARLQSIGITKPRGAILDDFLASSRDFYRGMIDGDGSLFWRRKKTRKEPQPYISLVGSKESLEQFSQFVRSYVPTCKAAVRWQGKIWHLAICGHHAKRLAEVLYADCETSLSRKQAIADEFIAWSPTKRYAYQ